MVTEGEVRHIAQIARLSLDGKEIEKYTNTLVSILGAIDQLKEIDTLDIELLINPNREFIDHYVIREDESRDSLPQDLILKNAPDFRYGQFRLDAGMSSDS